MLYSVDSQLTEISDAAEIAIILGEMSDEKAARRWHAILSATRKAYELGLNNGLEAAALDGH